MKDDVERKDKKVLITMTKNDYERAKDQANKYTDGNVSEWIRYTSKLDPKKEDLTLKVIKK